MATNTTSQTKPSLDGQPMLLSDAMITLGVSYEKAQLLLQTSIRRHMWPPDDRTWVMAEDVHRFEVRSGIGRNAWKKRRRAQTNSRG